MTGADQARWLAAVRHLRSPDVPRVVEAMATLDALATPAHLHALYALIDDDELLVREAAAVPSARLAGIEALPALLRAVIRNEQAGFDNDNLVPVRPRDRAGRGETARWRRLQMWEEHGGWRSGASS